MAGNDANTLLLLNFDETLPAAYADSSQAGQTVTYDSGHTPVPPDPDPPEHDASDVGFTPDDTSDWTGSADPGDLHDALDQLAARMNAIESGPVSRVFITNATGAGTISAKDYEDDTSPVDQVLEQFTSDDSDITIHLEVYTFGDPWQPASVTVSGAGATPVVVNKEDWTQVGSSRTWTATANLTDAGSSSTITATMSDGDTATVDYTRTLDPPEILTAAWNGTYPTDAETGLQSAVKSGDTVTLTGTVDTHATRITVNSYGASSSSQNFDDDYSSGTFSIDVTCGSGTGNQYFQLKANKDGGTYGSNVLTSNQILMDQAAHAYVTIHNLVFSPVGNFALKSGDSCTGDVQITNWSAGDDVIAYASSEVTISSSTAYTEAKTYTYLSGTYRDSGTNVTITARRKANGKQSTHSYLIKISNAAPTLTMSIGGSPARMRSKTGADKTYSLTISSNYELQEAPTCSRDSGNGDDGPALAGAWSGSAPDKTWTHTITIEEDDAKNTGADTYSWNAQTVLATSGSGLTVATIANNGTYTVGGFEEREIALDQFDEFEPIGTMATNKDNADLIECRVDQYGKTLTYYTDTSQHTDGYTICDSGGSHDADGDYVRCLDSAIYNAGLYYIQISEAAS